MPGRTDTIVAIATPPGVGGVSMVRISGDQALALAVRHLDVGTLQPRHATYCHFDELDDVVATYFPTGYTGEPTVEVSCHGSLYVQQAVVQTLIADGARLAEAGEFTMRAFANHRLDLSQAEAVADLIDATTPAQHQLAVSQLRGGYTAALSQLRQQMLDLTSLLELELDFGEEDVQFADRMRLQSLVEQTIEAVARLRHSFHTGNALKRGIPIAIVGRTNAGKSSLLNALLHDDRAIVSDIPGTTRDTIEETLTVDGILFRIIDTAGLRQSNDPIENLGFERAIRAAQQARIILFVRDIQEPFDAAAGQDISYITDRCDMQDKTLLLVHNKCDQPHIAPAEGYVVSAQQGTGIEQLKQTLAATVREETRHQGDVLLSNLRHYDALGHVAEALHHVNEGLHDGLPTDLVAIDLRDALYHLGTITGDVVTDEVLGNIFSRFCIGK